MNKIERVKAVFEGKEVDYIPSGYWYHFGGIATVKDAFDAHMKLYQDTDMDVIKIMSDFPFRMKGKIEKASDWRKLKASDFETTDFENQKELIKCLLDKAGSECMMFNTVFGAMKSAVMLCSDDAVMSYYREDKESLMEGVRVIQEVIKERVDAYLNTGVHGLYYSAQFSEPCRFTDEEWTSSVKPFDLEILDMAQKKEKYNIVHICGEPDRDFRVTVKRYSDYPGDIVNWATFKNKVSLQDGRDIFKRPILGGLYNRGEICTGTPQEVMEAVKAVIDAFGKTGLMLGADCTIQGKIDHNNIKAAVDACKQYR